MRRPGAEPGLFFLAIAAVAAGERVDGNTRDAPGKTTIGP